MPTWTKLFKLGFFAGLGWWAWSLIASALDLAAQYAFYVYMA